jgi:hypothetical protein
VIAGGWEGSYREDGARLRVVVVSDGIEVESEEGVGVGCIVA